MVAATVAAYDTTGISAGGGLQTLTSNPAIRAVYGIPYNLDVAGGFAVWRGLDKLGAELARFEAWAFVAACALAFASYLTRWLKWEFYLARLHIRGIPRKDSLYTFLSGFVLTVTPGKVG